MKNQAELNGYCIMVKDNNSITVTLDGEECKPVKPMLRAIAEESGFDYDAGWNTQTLGKKLVEYLNNVEVSTEATIEGEIVIEQVHYKLYTDGTAEAFSLEDGYDENIEDIDDPDTWINLTIPESITTENGDTYKVDKFTIPILSYIRNLELPTHLKSVSSAFSDTGTYFSRECIINLNGNPDIVFEDLVFYNSDKTVILNANILSPQGDYVIPEGVVEVADYAFHMAELMETITFPTTIRRIGYAFAECWGITNVYIKADSSQVQIFNNGNLCAFPSDPTIEYIGNEDDCDEDDELTVSDKFAILALHIAKLDRNIQQDEINEIVLLAQHNKFLDENEVINRIRQEMLGLNDYDVDDVMWTVPEKYYPNMFVVLVMVAFSDFMYTRSKQRIIKTLVQAWELDVDWCNDTIVKIARNRESAFNREIEFED